MNLVREYQTAVRWQVFQAAATILNIEVDMVFFHASSLSPGSPLFHLIEVSSALTGAC
jgi:hypothetical protein